MTAIGQENLEIHKVFRVMQTVGEMMNDRKYLVPSELIPKTYDEFVQMYVQQLDGGGSGENAPKRVIQRARMTLPCERRLGANGQCLRAIVFFYPNDGQFTKFLQEVLNRARQDGCDRVIIITTTAPNAIMKKSVDVNNRRENCIHVQLFEENDLAVNITKHELVPKHTPLEPEEVKMALQAHALELHQLPRILTTDPVAAYFGLERGQVVRIERKSMSAGLYVTYRQVV
ncbi:unnamed protein product [Phytomonas sp. EM1]|nr:unnamed protein product [Phytomonas sp. EM1]|eukprot:CCW61252.1 unnamed protein product [Phytomonas sp. isolate EM1]